MAANEPPYLTVGTDVSARYKGAFCEAKVKKVNRLVKCKVIFESNLGTMILPDDQLRGTLRLNSYVEARHPEKNQYLSATVNKIFDYSQYTVVFDDGDETTLRRTSLCLKSGRHFAESETLDRLPLTNPEHFGTPVLGSKGKRQRRSAPSCSSIDDESSRESFSPKGKKKCIRKDNESDIAKVVCVDTGDKRKKDSWFPALVVSPTSQETKVSPKDQYLVRSFKDGKYYPVKKKDARFFTKEIGAKVESSVLRTAVDKAMLYLNKDEIPPHWDWDLMMGQDVNSDDDEIKDSEVESSDDEPSEEKDRFVAQLYKFMDERGTPINRAPTITGRDLNLYKLFSIVQQMGGYNRVTNQNKWPTVYTKMGLPLSNPACSMQIKKAYKRYLHSFEDFNRKLGCTMVCNTRSGHVRHRSDRNIIMTRKREQNMPLPKSKIVKEVKKTPQEKPKVEEAPERIVRSRSVAKAEETEQNKQKETKSTTEPKLEKRETRGSTKNEQDKCKEPKVAPSKEKGKKEVTPKVKEEKGKDKTPKSNGKEVEKEKPSPLPSPPKVKMEDEKDQQSKLKVGKTEDKEHAEKPVRSLESSDSKPKRSEASVRIGDRIKVKYGRGKQHKMYEAKVLKIERECGERKFYVHYTGWNVRYDEWIKKGRIIEVVDGKSLSTKNPKRSHSWQGAQTKAILKRSMLFASPRKLCASAPKVPSSITLRARRQDSAPELRSINLPETRKLRSQLSEELHTIDNNETQLSLKADPEALDTNFPSADDTSTNNPSKQIKLEEMSDTEEIINVETIDDLIKDEDSWDVKEDICEIENKQFSAIEKCIKDEIVENIENVKPAEIVLKSCTVNLSQDNTNISTSESSITLDNQNSCTDVKSIKIEPLDEYSEQLSPDRNSEMKESASACHIENVNVENKHNSDTNCVDKNLMPPAFSAVSLLKEEKEVGKRTSDVSMDCLMKTEVADTKEHDNKLKLECKNEQDDKPHSDGNSILSEIAEQLVDLNKTIPDHLLSDEDMPPTLERKPDLITIDSESEVYETQPELKRAVSEVEETHNDESCIISQNTALSEDVCNKFDPEVVQQKNTDVIIQEVEQTGLSVPGSPNKTAGNGNDQEKITSEVKDETDSQTVLKKEKKKKSKVSKNEGDDTNAEETNITEDVIKSKNSKSSAKKKLDNNQEDGGEVKKKSKKLKDKKKKLKKHKNLKDAEDKDGTKEIQDGDLSKKEKKKRDDKIDSTIASVLGQKKGENSKKLKKCRKNKDKNSPKKGDALAEKKMKRKKKKKEAAALEADEKSNNDQTTSDSDKAAKLKKGKKKDKKKSKKKMCEPLELLDKTVEEAATTDIPEEKPSCKDPEEEKTVENTETTLESAEKMKEEEGISFLLCQEHVPASPLGDEFVEEQDGNSFSLTGLEQSEVIPAQPIIQPSSYVEHSLSNELPPMPSENVHSVISKHSEMLTVLENTPPTTPESTGTFLSTSPSYDQDMLSPDSTSPCKDTPETENDNSYQGPTQPDVTESEDSRTESAILFLANQAVCRNKVLPSKRPSESDNLPPRKKKATKCYSSETNNKAKHSSKSSSKGELKELDVSSTTGNSSTDSAGSTAATGIQPVRTSRFNFYVPLDDTMDSDRRIAVIQNSLSELKKAYMALKAEVAMIDRHRKKAKRKEKELAAAAATSTVNTSAQKDGTEAS